MNKQSRNTILLLLFFLICMGASFYFSRYKLVVYPIEGRSMEPTIRDDDRVLVYRTQNIKYNDVVILDSEEFGKTLIKRVIGLGGDTISVKYNEDIEAYEIWRNGKVLHEDYIQEKMIASSYTETEIKIPEGHFFYLGDNRNISKDSHYGDITEDTSVIVGKVIMKYKGFKMKFKLAYST